MSSRALPRRTLLQGALVPADWRQHFHPFWKRFEQAKRRYDPDGILTPGQGIF